MIVELNGLPGSGKSYFVDYATRIFNLNGKNTKNMAIMENKILFKLFQKVCENILLIKYLTDKKTRQLRNKYIDKKAFYATSISFDKYLKRLLYLNNLYFVLKKRQTIYMFDEGIYQVITAMAVDFSMDKSDIAYLLNLVTVVEKNIITVFYDCNVEDCICSIKKRNRQVCDIDKINEDELKEMLKKYFEYISSFKCYSYDSIHLCRKDNLDRNIMFLEKRLKI